MKAIIIDDSRTARSILRRALTQEGFDLIEAGDGRAALDALALSGPVDLALVDWNMPVMTGLEFIRALRALPEFDRTVVMVVTSESEVAQVERALAAGADEYVMKPFTEGALREKLVILGLLAAAAP